MDYNNEDEWNRLLGDFVSKFSRLNYLISDLVVTLGKKDKIAQKILEDEFNALSQDNKNKNRKKTNFQSLHDTIEINKNNPDCNLAVIVSNHFAHFWITLQCFRKQIQGIFLDTVLIKELNNLLGDLDKIVETRNDLLHCFIVPGQEERGMGVMRYRIEQDGVMTKKDIAWFLDKEAEKIIEVWTNLNRLIKSIN